MTLKKYVQDGCVGCANLNRPNGGYCFVHKKKPAKVPCEDYNPL